VVRAYAVEDRTQERIDTAIDAYKAAGMRAQRFTVVSFSLGGLSAGLGNAGVMILGVWLGVAGEITAGEILAFAFLVTLFVGPVQMGTQIITDAQNAIAGWRRVLRDSGRLSVRSPARVGHSSSSSRIETLLRL
jgi:ATP-binding cassette, subfamily B, bacterial